MQATHTVAMRGFEVSELGGPEVLSYAEISQLSPGAGEALIKAEAIGGDFSGTYFRAGPQPGRPRRHTAGPRPGDRGGPARWRCSTIPMMRSDSSRKSVI